MAYNNIENNIVDTIQYMVDNAVAAAPYDKTIQCTVLSCEDESTGKYKVRYQDAIFYAYANNVDTTYSSGSNVYVLVPGNDSSREKTILGDVNRMGEGYMSIVDNEILYFPIGGNAIDISRSTPQSLFQLWSYEKEERNRRKSIPFKDSQEASSYDNIRVDNTNLQHNLAQAEYIKLGAKFTTNIPFEQRADLGNYGVTFTLEFKTNSGIEGETIERTYTIDINDIINNPYGLDDSEQTLVFPVDGKNFLSVKKIEIFCKDFPIQKEHSEDPEVRALEYDIIIKDFIINALDKIDESKLNGPWITIVCPQGNSFDHATKNQSKNIRVNTYKGSQQINADSRNLQYFWFVEDARIDPNCENKVPNSDPDITNPSEQVNHTYFDAFYSKYGGYGWKCLNKFHIVEEETDEIDPETGRPITKKIKEWESGDYNFTIEEQKLVAKETKYKCAVLYNEYLMTDIKTFINYNSVWDINITTDTEETIFYFDTGEPELMCNVSYIGPEPFPEENLTYLWNKSDNLGKITYLKNEIENKMQIFIRDIFNFATYTCFVFNNGIPIGQAAITITNSLESGGQYSLVITNGTQVYKYNEYGLAPNEGSTDEPVVIQPLGYILYDMLGKEVRHDVIADTGKEWLVPAENTMLEFDLEGRDLTYYNADGTDYDEEKGGQRWYKFNIVENGDIKTEESLTYKIKDRYDYRYTNNTIRLKIKYQGTYFVAETNFVFTKEGEPGTNGSDYYCRIVPNLNGGLSTNYPLIIVDSDRYRAGQNIRFCLGGRICENSEFVDGLDNFLRVELWRNGKQIISNQNNPVTGFSTENIPYTTEWSFLSNHYNGNEIYDFSYLEWKKEQDRWWIREKLCDRSPIKDENKTDSFYLGKSRIDDNNFPFNSIIPYFGFDDKGKNGELYYNAPALIAKCTINYNGMNYYATYPIIWVNVFTIQAPWDTTAFDLEDGFSSVVYAADGCKPQYHDEAFKIKVKRNGEDITNSFSYTWDGYGGLYEKEHPNNINEKRKWIIKDNCLKEVDYNIQGYLNTRDGKFYRNYDSSTQIYSFEIAGEINKIYHDKSSGKNYEWNPTIDAEGFIQINGELSKRFKPQDRYDGHCVNNILECLIKNNEGFTFAVMQIPIHFMLNKYGHAALNQWDGNSISIDKDGNGVILAPQVGAGQKENDNSFTGVLMRKSKRSKS